jgi:hypothetical protein
MGRRRRRLTWLLPALLCLGIGCDRVGAAAERWLEETVKLTPVPEDRLASVGTWEGDGMTLVIGAEGSLAYHRADDGGTRSLEAPLVRFEGDDIVAGFAGIESRFEVEEPPHEGADGWEMTVDGVRLRRVSTAGPERAPPRPEAPGTRESEEGVAI